MNETIYAAYGSNIPTQRLIARCPQAVFLGTASLQDYRLVFRKTADIEACTGRFVPVALWRLNPDDEARLDRFEGVPRTYRKEYLTAAMEDRRIRCLVYLKNDGALSSPAADYLQFLEQGYAERGFDMSILSVAIQES